MSIKLNDKLRQIGLSITGPQFKDGETLNIAHKIEEALGYKGLIKEEYDV